MYSSRKIQERIEAICRTSSWQPEYHSLAQIESFNKHADSLRHLDPKGNYHMNREFNHDELQWIANEYNLCACDYPYWSSNYVFINVKSEIVRFTRRHSQSMLLKLWAEREDLNLGIEQIVLKARQQGISTEVELSICHRTNFGFGVISAIASSSQDQAERMSGMYNLAYDEMPYWMQANPTSDRTGSLIAFGGNKTRLSIYGGRMINGLAPGG